MWSRWEAHSVISISSSERFATKGWGSMALDPTAKGWSSPSIIVPGHKERFLFGLKVLANPAEVQVRVSPSGTRMGVSHGSGRAPSAGFPFIVERRRRNQGAWP